MKKIDELKAACLNKRKLNNICNEYGLYRIATENYYREIIATKKMKHIGVIDCMPSNNGKYYAVRNGSRMMTNPFFETFDKAIDWLIRDNKF